MSTRKVLGRGLEALIPGAATIEQPQPGERVVDVPTDAVDANPFQPRKRFDDERLKELAEDCEQDGIYEFFFCGPPLIITGGTGSPINPQAIK